VGRGAPEHYLGFLQNLANVHDERLKLDELRAYHFGQRYLVELEVILPAAMSVQESHDIALGLQHKASRAQAICTGCTYMGCRLACCCHRSKLLQHQ
jgi:divalent metal cation (Fe/Co/Zn/Cd) transporter